MCVLSSFQTKSIVLSFIANNQWCDYIQ